MATQAAFASFNFYFFFNVKSRNVETLFQDVEINRWILGNRKALLRAGGVSGLVARIFATCLLEMKGCGANNTTLQDCWLMSNPKPKDQMNSSGLNSKRFVRSCAIEFAINKTGIL